MRFWLLSILIHGIFLFLPWTWWNHEERPQPISNQMSIEFSSPAHSLSAMAEAATTHSAIGSQMPEVQKDATSSFVPSEVIRQRSTVPVAGRAPAVLSETSKLSTDGSGSYAGVAGQPMNRSNAVGGGTGGSATSGSALTGENFVRNGDGTYTALSPAGIDYTIARSVEANYPEEARAVGYARTIRVEAAILVGLDGNVESVSILNNVPDLGFREAARQALQQWKFSPIYYQGINIKMNFYKNIYFEPS